jgi:RNA-binding protein YhbY
MMDRVAYLLILALILIAHSAVPQTHGFAISPGAFSSQRLCRLANFNYGRHSTVADSNNLSEAVDEGEDDEKIDHDDDEEDPDVSPNSPMESAWRYAKKPLLRIGSKGATPTHGNSLRQLLEHHTVVKVKVNTRRFDNSLEEAFKQLRKLAEEHGAPQGIELLQAREADKVILFGWPGTRSRIELGEFPLPEPEPEPEAEERET